MTLTASQTNQSFWRLPEFPHIELRSTFDCAQHFKRHSHPALSLGAVVKGNTCADYLGDKVICHAGDLVLVPPGAAHGCDPIDAHPRSYYMLYIDADWCLSRLSEICEKTIRTISCQQFLIQNAELFSEYLDIVEFIRLNAISELKPKLEMFLMKILNTYCLPENEGQRIDPLSLDVKKLYLQHLDDPPSLESLAKKFNCRQETIIRNFNKSFGISPRVFVNNARVEKAKVLLREGNKISDVANTLGFGDQAQFHKTFVLFTASTPFQYQQASEN